MKRKLVYFAVSSVVSNPAGIISYAVLMGVAGFLNCSSNNVYLLFAANVVQFEIDQLQDLPARDRPKYNAKNSSNHNQEY